jgi:HEAT repeat protein
MGDEKRASHKESDGNDSVCAEIAAALGNFGPDAAPAAPVLSAIVADPLFAWDKSDAIVTLGKIGPAAKDAVPQLIKILDEKDSDLPRLAAVALGRIGPAAKAAAARLLKLSISDPDEDIREAARTALQRIAPEAAPPTRIQELGNRKG